MANNKMLIDAAHPEETRVAMVRGNRVDEFDFESEHKTQLRGNIYLAKVTRVEPSLQAAFVDYGGNRHGFLAFSEIHPDYYQIPVADRQALLDADAEDARLAAAEEAKRDDDEAADDEASTEDDKPAPRKRRSRRRGGKKTAEASDEGNQDEETEASSEEPAKSSDDSEEDDSDENNMAADNDGDDVVSEPAKKPRRRTSRKAKEPEAEVKAEEAATADEAPKKPKRRASRKKVADDGKVVAEKAAVEETAEEAPTKKPRRRTSRKKEPVEAEAEKTEAVAEEQSAPEAKEEAPKPQRRSTRRKKKDDAEVETQTEVEAKSEDTPEAKDGDRDSNEAEEKPKRKPRRSRSRRKPNDDTENGNDDSENGSVEDIGSDDAMEEVPVRRVSRRHYKIQEVIKRRQILLVQVVKEERGNKGAALTTYLSLAGRYSVLMPNTARGGGISRKITSSSDRKRLKSVAAGLEVPQGMGVILRTAGASRKPEEIQRDFEYLMRLWESVRTLTLESTAPCLVYEEGSLIKRSIRDLFDKDTGEILVAGENGYREAKDFMNMLMPEQAKNVKQYKERVPIFARMGVEAQLDAMLQPQVTLKSGGYLIINQTEALVAIDVNSGRSTRQHSVEDTATQTNLEAADEVARQLRLRDLAGLVVIDFIDMEDKRNVRNVEKRLKDALKHDRARIQVGRISHFGLMEMSRQRIRASVLESTTQVCPTCEGLGHVRSSSSVVLGVLRAIEENLNRNSRNNLSIKTSTATALYMLNSKRETLSDLEERFGVALTISADDHLGNLPCVIERGELSNRVPTQEAAVQPDSIAADEASQDAPESTSEAAAPSQEDNSTSESNGENGGENGEGRKRRRRRRRRKGSDTNGETAEAEVTEATSEPAAEARNDESSSVEVEAPAEEDAKPKRRARRSKKVDAEADTAEVATEEQAEPTKKPRRATRKKAVEEPVVEAESTPEAANEDEDPAPKRRTTRRKVSANETETVSEEPAAEPVADLSDDEGSKKSKRGGWWQRKFF